MSNWIKRKKTKSINVGSVPVGGNNPISIQSMTNTNTCDVVSTVKQINDLEAAGADIVRVSVPSIEAAESFKAIKKNTNIPLVSDIHFDYKIALEVLKYGVLDNEEYENQCTRNMTENLVLTNFQSVAIPDFVGLSVQSV